MNLHLNKDYFDELIIATSNELGISKGIVEKDYYVTLALKELNKNIPDMVCDILSPLSLTLRSGSFSLNTTSVVSINELSPCVPRFLYLFIISYL